VTEEVPPTLRASAVVQLVSGIVNLFLVSWLASVLWVSIGGTVSMFVMAICTLGLCPLPVGSLCGFVGFIIAPLALLEIGSGIVGLVSPRAAKPLMIATAIVELLCLFLANPVAFVAGLVSLGLVIASRR
jgi:hypothetical protein